MSTNYKELKSLAIFFLGMLPLQNNNRSNICGENPLAEYQAKKTREEAKLVEHTINPLIENFCEECLDGEKILEWILSNKETIEKHRNGFGGIMLKLAEDVKNNK